MLRSVRQGDTASALRLMTYNVRYFGHGTKGVISTGRAMRNIARSVASLQPAADIICLQEVETRSLRSNLISGWTRGRRTQLQALLRELDLAFERRGVVCRYQAEYFPAHQYRLTSSTNLYTTGLAVLVHPRLRITSHNAFVPQDITHRRGAKRLKQTRICAHIAVQAPSGARLDVFNTHMSLPGPFYWDFWRRGDKLGFGPNQLSEARRLIEVIRHRASCDNVVLVGDFNSLPGSHVDRFLRQRANLVDALAQTKGLSGERLRAWSTAGFMQKRMNIDRIYSSKGVKWLDFDGSEPFATSPFAGLSDHVPLLGRLRLPG